MRMKTDVHKNQNNVHDIIKMVITSCEQNKYMMTKYTGCESKR